MTPLAAGPRAVFPPEVAIHVVHLACERPDPLGRSLSQWDGTELARQLSAEGIVEEISAATVTELIDLYTRPLRPDELVLSVDEQTSLQPRPRRSPTRPAQLQNIPNRYEHE